MPDYQVASPRTILVLIFGVILLALGVNWISRGLEVEMICENNRLDDPRPRDAHNCYIDE